MTPARRLLRRLAPLRAPVALIALPILGAGLLAWSAAEAERAAAAARRVTAAGLHLAAVAEKLETRAQTFAAQAVAMAAARNIEDLHGLVASNDLILAAIYRGEQRLFPPQDSAGLTAAEARALAALHGGDLRLEDARPGLRVVVRLRTLIEPEGEEAPPCAC